MLTLIDMSQSEIIVNAEPGLFWPGLHSFYSLPWHTLISIVGETMRLRFPVLSTPLVLSLMIIIGCGDEPKPVVVPADTVTIPTGTASTKTGSVKKKVKDLPQSTGPDGIVP